MGRHKKNVLVILLVLTLTTFNIIMAVVIIQKKNDADETAGNILDNIEGTNDAGENSSSGIAEGENNMQNLDNGQNSNGVSVTLCDGFYYEPISDGLREYITNKSFKANDKIHYSDLRHVVVKYVDFNGQTSEGELIVNVLAADDVLAIFKELYDVSYPIEKIRLIDEYNADDDASMSDNNSSAFNYRTIDGTNEISDHGYGIAVDINPLYNPYVRKGFGDRNVLPVNGSAYADRNASFEHKIVKGDVCYQAFVKRGWKWGGEWDSPVDYQHFYKEIYH